jgi:hypothetical protein
LAGYKKTEFFTSSQKLTMVDFIGARPKKIPDKPGKI